MTHNPTDEDEKDGGRSSRVKDLMSQLAENLGDLRTETEGLVVRMRAEIEAHWTSRHSEIFPRLLVWKERISAVTFSTFSMRDGKVAFEPLLSDATSPAFPSGVPFEDVLPALTHHFGKGFERVAPLALGSCEAQFHFVSQAIAVPLVLFDSVSGLVFARVPGLEPSQYTSVCDECGRLAQAVRKLVLSGWAGYSHIFPRVS